MYPCHAVVVAMQANNGQQKFFVGHTDKVSALLAVLLYRSMVIRVRTIVPSYYRIGR